MFQLPDRTIVDRKIPKSKFYEKLQVNQQLKDLFIQQVESVLWKHKLSRETARLEPREEIEEIQMFEIWLKKPTYSLQLLRAIDKSIPYPILHVLRFEDQARLAIAYKEKNASDDNKAVIHSYHESEWRKASEFEGYDLLRGLDLKSVYEHIIRSLLTHGGRSDEGLSTVLERQARINKLTQECNQLEAKIRKERQFHRKVELNMELQRKKMRLGSLMENDES